MTESAAMAWQNWEKSIVRETERYLSWRKKRELARKAKQKQRNPVVDWIDAILSAVVIVLLINQYLLQAYQIPSPSMEPSLLVSDRIFVNKIVYGPELIPGMLKIPGPWLPAARRRDHLRKPRVHLQRPRRGRPPADHLHGDPLPGGHRQGRERPAQAPLPDQARHRDAG